MRNDPATSTTDAPASGWSLASVREWSTRHARVVDAVAATAATAAGALAVLVGGSADSLLTLVGLLVAGAALLWARRAPFAVVAIVGLLGAVAEPRFFIAVAAVAVFQVAAQRRMRVAMAGYLVVVGLPLLGTAVKIMLGLDSGATAGHVPAVGLGTSVIEPFVVIAWALGLVMQSTRHRARTQEELVRERIANARALERSRIAAEMHDVVGHALTVMIALANGARVGTGTDPVRAAEALSRLTEVGATALGDMQRTLRLLRDSDAELDEALRRSGHDLAPLEDSVEVFRAAGLPVTLTRTGDPFPDDALLTATVHRIVQEALTNALRYARDASRVDVTLSHESGVLTIVVVDDGIPGAPASVGTRRGLIGIAERASAFDGTSTAGPRAPRGWETRAVLRTGERP